MGDGNVLHQETGYCSLGLARRLILYCEAIRPANISAQKNR
jgi:hypothetical protein